MREASYSTLRLGLYEPIKRNLGDEGAIWSKFAAGALSGMIGSAIANPADLLKNLIQSRPETLCLHPSTGRPWSLLMNHVHWLIRYLMTPVHSLNHFQSGIGLPDVPHLYCLAVIHERHQ